MSNLRVGDYVLATKYQDGDACDQWQIGFFESFDGKRYQLKDTMRPNGYRRCERIAPELGKAILKDKEFLERGCVSLWDYRDGFYL